MSNFILRDLFDEAASNPSRAELRARARELASELAAIRNKLRTPKQRHDQAKKAAEARWRTEETTEPQPGTRTPPKSKRP